MHNYINMQRENYSSESVRFTSDATQNPQYIISSEGQANSSIMPGMQQNPRNVLHSGSTLTTSQPPPYPASQPLPSMTHAFSQQRQPQYSGNVVSPGVPYHSPQAAYQGQSTYSSTGAQGQAYIGGPAVSPSSIPALSPSGRLSMPQGMQSLSPGAQTMPRKSLAGMMSPIRAQQSLHMPPPSSPVLRLQGPVSPLSIYMSQAQSPRRTPVGQVQSMPGRGYPPPHSPVYQQQPMPYPYGPQQPQIPPSSPVANPRYLNTSQHGQMSPLVQAQGHLHSPQPGPSAGLTMQVQRSPFKAARQLNMATSPTKVHPYSGAGMPQQWQYASRATTREMWESAPIASVIPSLPILSSDTLDLLSTLTVSTVTSPVQSSAVPGVAGSRMPKSPLLQQHLLMPAQPIRTPSTEGNLLIVSGTGMPLTTGTTAAPSIANLRATTEAPPSRRNQTHSVRPTLIVNEETLINPSDPAITTCTIAASTLSTSSIVTSICTDKTVDPEKRGENMNTPSSASGLAVASEAGSFRNSSMVPMSNPTPMDVGVGSSVKTAASSQSVCDTALLLSESFVDPSRPQSCEISLVPPEILENRKKLCEFHKTKLQEKLVLYKECLTELFFLQNGGNFMDYAQFKKRPSTKLLDYLKKMIPENKQGCRKLRKISQDSFNSNGEAMSPASDTSNTSSKKNSSEDSKKARFPSESQDTSVENIRRSQMQDHPAVFSQVGGTKSLISPSSQINHVPASKGQSSPLRLKRLSRQGPPATLDESMRSQEEILERAKQEAVIQRKVVELRKRGLWTQRRLPKVQEPPRNKTHWDYLLEEMRWLSADFAQERKWKRAAARKLVRAVTGYHKEQHDHARRLKREEHNRLRRIASTMAREIRIFWGNIGKVVEYKQRSLLDEKRQKALDLHLSYIVDQTEKYSDWLTQGLNKQQPSGWSSPSRSLSSSKQGSDDDFLPQGASSDDEETIAVAEQEFEIQENTEDELSLLKQESELPFDELLNSLPPELIENIGKPLEGPTMEELVEDSEEDEKPVTVEAAEATTSEKDPGVSSDEDVEPSKPTPISLRRSARKRKASSTDFHQTEDAEETKKLKVKSEETEGDEEFKAEDEESNAGGGDDEATMEEEEKKDEVDHEKEIADLQVEGEMPIEELMKMYGAAFDQDNDQEDETAEEDESQDDEPEAEEAMKEESSSESDEEESGKEEDEDIGMDYLFKADLTKDVVAQMITPTDESESKEEKMEEEKGSPSKEITDVAAEAASLQPTGFTLATTQVVTPIPILLKHTLREYQHIGLDWLVTMYDKRLNGILADEMGLGKTMQTIALLAHLACDKGVWGPHLIVVPTSVMLNWEMEFKKWCPGFKILTYYGSQKERKAKRTGWTKSNAFHVCITSYKLVLQDNTSFRRKKWKYLVLDEAQNIKNFKSQRWQTLLNFNSQRRLLLTGTPLQNNLMELWSLMHFLMPHVFQSHKEFKEWFSNPLTGMIEGSHEYNEKLVRRLHKVLRPFLLRRMKKDVEKQMPNKYEHVVRCHLSKRQRFLYDDFMSQGSTKDTLECGHFMSVINILMQLRKVCNHPNLFEPRPIVSPFMNYRVDFHASSLVTKVLDKGPFQTLNLQDYHLHLPSLTSIDQYNARRIKQLKPPRKLIEELDVDRQPLEEERHNLPRMQVIKEHLGSLVKERDRQKMKNVTALNLSQQSLHLLQHGQQTGTLPVLTIPITSSMQLSTSSGTTRVITLPHSRPDDSSGRVATSQSFTLQYQTPQGTRVSIPGKQVIHQIPGRVLQIMTPGAAGTKAQTISQPVISLSQVGQGSLPHQNGGVSMEPRVSLAGVNKSGKNELETLELKSPSSYLERLEHEFLREHRHKCSRMADMNDKRCDATPEWLPGDTIDLLKNIYKRPEERKHSDRNLIESAVMPELVKSGDVVLQEMMPVTDRFVFVIPTVEAKHVDFHVSHPSPSQKNSDEIRAGVLESALKREVGPLHSIDLKMRIQFPEARLIQYDCGKLQVLNVLLRRLWGEKHKCLIFTQMTKVLDVLEAFLSYHGYRYLRLDGSTKVEQRMLLMERFNNDKRIFCFILSTRSGGIGVNLTGADTVIFYDSDWNPTMDAQAQDRCHRIGQTRDVHIYRLISERTVEENILKKANQKRLLGDLAIEGGSFTTAFFKEQAIKDLFNAPSGLEDLSPSEKDEKKSEQSASAAAVLSKPVTARQKAIAAAKEAEGKAVAAGSTSQSIQPKASSWEDVLQQTEDKEDVDAAIQLREEQDADMEEFTENAEGEEATEVSKVHEEMRSIYEELAPIEKYALRYLEETTEEMNREELEMAEEEVYRSKQDWEIAHLVALKEEEERRLEEEEDEIFYTREDAENQIYIDDVTGETMPVWFPPTPPQDDNDIYIDPIARLLYLPGPMSEDQLPAIHVRRERKRTKTEPDGPGGVPSQKRKLSRAEFLAPRSLFNRPQSQFKKRELKQPKYRPQLKKVHSVLPQAKAVALPTLPTLSSASADKENVTAAAEQQGLPVGSASAVSSTDTLPVSSSNKSLDWLVNEDWKLLQAVQQVLEMPLTLAVLLPAHTANWDLVADIVNSISSVYRSPKMCKQHFENVIAPREEGRTAPELQRDIKKKIKGTKTPTKVKINKPQKTVNIHCMDNNIQQSVLYSNRFSAIKETCSKRTMPIKTSSLTAFQRNPKHTSMLMENGITYDKPLPPIQIASLRADRIAREKALEVAKQQQQQLVQSQAIQAHSSNMQQISSGQVSKPGLTSLGQLTAIPLSGSASNIIVNPSALSAITKKINQHTASKTSLGNTTLQQTLLRTVVSASDQSQQMQQHQPQIQIQQPGQAGTMVTVGRLLHRLSSPGATTSITTAVASNNTIPLSSLSRPSITIPTGAVIQQSSQQLTKQQQLRLQQQMQLQLQKQQRKPVKAQLTPRKLQITPEAMKKLTQQRQQQQQQLEANVVTVPGKQRKTTITQQELEQLLLKNPTMRRQMPKAQTTQVQIAPVHAQVQAQHVQEAAAQQAAQHVVTSKPLPITVPVSNLVSVAAVNLGGMNMSISSTSAQGKSLVMTGQQVPAIIQQQLHRQLMKQRLVTQQQQQQQQQAQLQNQQQGQMQSKVGVKQTVYAMVAAPPHMTQGKRRVNVTASTSGQQLQSSSQQPVQLTVTKLLQSQSIPGQPTTQLKQSMTQQSAEAMAQHIRQQQQSVAQQQLQVASATIVPSSNVMQQRLLTSQRRIRQIQHMASNPQSSQMILTSASPQQFIHRPNQNVVASISIGAPSTAVSAQHQMTLSTPIQQNTNLSQQLQSLLTPQVLRAHSQPGVTVQAAMRPSVQQHHLLLSQVTPQQTLAISPQNPPLSMTSPMTPTTMTLAPSLIQLPVSVIPSVVGSQSQLQMAQPPIPDGSSSGLQQQPTSVSMQYVTRTMPQQ